METNGEGTATPQEEMASGKEELTAKIKVHVLTVDLKARSGLSDASKSIPSLSLAFLHVHLAACEHGTREDKPLPFSPN